MTDPSPSLPAQKIRKTLWDWLHLLLLPVVLLACLLWWSWLQNQWQVQMRNQQLSTALQIAHAQQQQSLLSGYMDAMTDLMLHEQLTTANQMSSVRLIAQVRTDTLLRLLDAQGKGAVLRFLFETKLISNDTPIINFRDADLQGAYLRNMDLRDSNITGADLSGADLRGANLTYATMLLVNLSQSDLQGTNLRGSDLHSVIWKSANLNDANLQDALGVDTGQLSATRSFSGTILPDGSIHR